MTFDELRCALFLVTDEPGSLPRERQADLATLRRLFPLLVDLAEEAGKMRGEEYFKGTGAHRVAVHAEALRVAMNPPPVCPVCGDAERSPAGAACMRALFQRCSCTRPDGHAGDHCSHSHDGRRIASWPQGGETW